MTPPRFGLPAEVRWLLACSVLSFFATVPHAFEDFEAGEMTRFGVHLSVLQYGLGVALLVALQGIAIAASARTARSGYLLSVALAAFWLVGAGLLHLPDVLTGPFRSGVPSAALVAGIMATNLAVGVAGITATARSYRGEQQFRLGHERWSLPGTDDGAGQRPTRDAAHPISMRSRS